MKKISFICCYTNESMLEDMKHSTECLKDYDIEWVLIDNKNNCFTSAAEALNYGFSQSTSDFVVFLHQDIILYDQITIDKIVGAVEQGYIAGFAGRKVDGGKVVSCFTDGQNKNRVYDYDFGDNDWIEVLTCDECFIAMSREIYAKVGGFDEINFDGWHLYGVDFTLTAAEKNIPVVVVPANAWHRSYGTMNKDFDRYKNVLRKKYKSSYSKIYYPCGWTYTSTVKYYSRLVGRCVKNFFKKGKLHA